MKTGALWWRVDANETDRDNPEVALDWAGLSLSLSLSLSLCFSLSLSEIALDWAEKYLHMADGMYFADEEITYGGEVDTGLPGLSLSDSL